MQTTTPQRRATGTPLRDALTVIQLVFTGIITAATVFAWGMEMLDHFGVVTHNPAWLALASILPIGTAGLWIGRFGITHWAATPRR